MAARIDSHQHFWQLDKTEFDYSWLDAPALATIKRDFLPSDLKPLLDAAGIEKSVFVQTQHNVEETRWVLKMAEQNDFLAGVVGWVDLAGAHCEEQLLEFKDHPKFAGIRHVTHDEPDDDFIVRPEVIRGLKVLEKHRVPFDLLFYVKHLHHAQTLAQQLPDLPMVIDHLSKPHIKDRVVDNWLDHFKAAAAHENVYCKLSGMITEADWQSWKPADLKPYVDAALETFGPRRLMFGSDWPVCLLAGSYARMYAAADEVLGDLSETERGWIFGKTAAEFYGLDV